MRDPLRERVSARQVRHSRRSRLAALLLLLSLLVAGDVFWSLRQPGIAMAGDATCGMEDHVHTDSCYDHTPICGLTDEVHIHDEDCYTLPQTEPELCCVEDHAHTEACDLQTQNQAEPILTCTRSTEPHIHDTSCYDLSPICGKLEHTHTLACYSDSTADTETLLDWQSMFSGLLTGDLARDLVAVAQSQIGYSESQRNFQVDELGQCHGYTRYGAWYGFPYEDWSAMFVSFCLSYAGSTTEQTPFNIGAGSMARLWQQQGRYTDSSYSPLPGDLVFFSGGTVAILSEVSGSSLTVIQGDWLDAVCQRTLSAADGSILGYGIITVQQPAEEPSATDAPAADVPAEDTPAQPAEPDEDITDGQDSDPNDQTPPTPDAPDDTLNAEAAPLLGASAAFVLRDCDCPSPAPEDIADHPATCARQFQLTALAEVKTPQELYDLWPQLPTDCQNYLLSCLDADARATLEALLAESGGEVSPGTLAVTASDGTQFQLSGQLPDNAALEAETVSFSQQQLVQSTFNANDWDYIHQCWLYDLAISAGGSHWQPTEPVQVTVSNPAFTVTGSELLCVCHLRDDGSILSTQYLRPEDGTVTFSADGFSPYLFYTVDMEMFGGEKITGTNWMTLRDSGWASYWAQAASGTSALSAVGTPMVAAAATDSATSSQQIDRPGGTEDDGRVSVSKTIAGTDIENVFDITLTVQTQQQISQVYEEPDMAVVIVMDISNTMNDDFGGETRYAAAMEAAEDFLDTFVEKTGEVSKIGYVAFNTDAHKIFDLTNCPDQTTANSLKNTMRQKTSEIINKDGYKVAHNRFTNVEAGLKLGYDMLAKSTNSNKYIIFLSDGFPTTYIKSGYNGYDPYTLPGTIGTDGIFYDSVLKVYCSSGTSYSDKAAIRAREMATKIKNAGVQIFSIGVDVGGQTIQKYIEDSEKLANGAAKISIVDRTGTSYEIGNASSTESYKNWLKTAIGSNYYYDSTNIDGLKTAYSEIMEKILNTTEEASKADWVTEDPLPNVEPTKSPESLEFIGFFDRSNTLLYGADQKQLTGSNTEGGENTAAFAPDNSTITWDLKESGYTTETADGVTLYRYRLTYRVRLKNEWSGFQETTIYNTNDTTTLSYRLIEKQNGSTTLSQLYTIDYPIPAVHGYLAELEFQKEDPFGNALSGVEFTLTHDTGQCSVCRGDGHNSVAQLESFTAQSDDTGTVRFPKIPSGHTYTLTETVPEGYTTDGRTYTVAVAYDTLTVTVADSGGNPVDWDGVIVNIPTSYVLPATGGSGTWPWLFSGLGLIGTSLALLLRRKRRGNPYFRVIASLRRRRGNPPSPRWHLK